MPDFSQDIRDEDPALLGKLRAMLRAPDQAPRPRPTLEARFGAPAARDGGSGRTESPRAQLVPATAGEPHRR